MALLSEKYSSEKDKQYVRAAISEDGEIAQILQELVRENIDIYEVTMARTDLENLFMDITNT